MSSLSLANAIGAGKTLGFVADPYQSSYFGRNQRKFISVPFLGLSRTTRTSISVQAKLKKKPKIVHERPWPDMDDVEPVWKKEHLIHLSPYKPLNQKGEIINLQFEKPLIKLRTAVLMLNKMARTSNPELKDLSKRIEAEYIEMARSFYSRLEPIQKVHIARHPQRPTFLDHVINMTDRWIELHGDKAGYDDPAIVCALGEMEGKTYMFIGHQKGRDSKENIKRNFGMPTPHGYRKALKFMRYAERKGFPIITLVDTPGAFADLKSEELNQGEAIANNIRSMFGIKVPIVSVVIGEGGSGGALAIACANKLLMLQNSVFFVASPEACASILFKSAAEAPRAAKQLRITADSLQAMEVCDEIVPEPLGGAHRDHVRAAQMIKEAVLKNMQELEKMDLDELLDDRRMKFRKVGAYKTEEYIDPIKTRKMKKREVAYSIFDLVDRTPLNGVTEETDDAVDEKERVEVW